MKEILSALRVIEDKTTRTQAFYDQFVVPSLKKDVQEAERQRVARDHDAVGAHVRRWVNGSQEKLIIWKLHNRRDLLAQRTTDDVRVGLAGIGRISHVDMNTSGQLDPDNRRIIDDLYNALHLENLPHRTIDDNAIFWTAEVLQDRARTSQLEGDAQHAEQYLTEARTTIERILDSEDLPDAQALGLRSALGVILTRLGMMTDDPHLTHQGLSLEIMVGKKQYNPDRLETLAGWSLQSNLKAVKSDWRNTFSPKIHKNVLIGAYYAFPKIARDIKKKILKH